MATMTNTLTLNRPREKRLAARRVGSLNRMRASDPGWGLRYSARTYATRESARLLLPANASQLAFVYRAVHFALGPLSLKEVLQRVEPHLPNKGSHARQTIVRRHLSELCRRGLLCTAPMRRTL